MLFRSLDSRPGGRKPLFLTGCGLQVVNPLLPRDDFPESVRIAGARLAEDAPDVVVGSSRGGAVAMALRPTAARLVLIAPAWRHFGVEPRLEGSPTILHSEQDEIIPIEDSRELLRRSSLPNSCLQVVGRDHSMNDPEALSALLEAVRGEAKDAGHDRSQP